MTLKEITNTVAEGQGVKPRVARQIITKSLQMILREIQEGRDIRIAGVCVVRSKEMGKTEAEKVRVGLMRAAKPKK